MFDCVAVLAGRAFAVANKIRFRKISATGEVLDDKVIAVEQPLQTSWSKAVGRSLRPAR